MTDTLDAKQWALDHSPDALKGRKIAVAYGGGSNSTALLLRFHELGIVPNLILFADTGGERPDVYKGIEQLNGRNLRTTNSTLEPSSTTLIGST